MVSVNKNGDVFPTKGTQGPGSTGESGKYTPDKLTKSIFAVEANGVIVDRSNMPQSETKYLDINDDGKIDYILTQHYNGYGVVYKTELDNDADGKTDDIRYTLYKEIDGGDNVQYVGEDFDKGADNTIDYRQRTLPDGNLLIDSDGDGTFDKVGPGDQET